MKKTIVKLLAIFIAVTLFTISYTHDECEHCHNNTVYATEDGDACPNCGNALIADMPYNYLCSNDPADITYTCFNCGYSTTETKYPPDHNYVKKNSECREPTCTSAGKCVYYCSVCGEKYEETVPANGHKYVGTVTTEPTCEKDGVKTYKCSVCSDTYTSKIDALGHDYKKTIIKEATCTEDGKASYKCKNCGDEYEEVIKKLGHNYLYKITKKATCTEDGTKTWTCTLCKDVKEEVIPKLGHEYKETEKIEPSCTKDGYIKSVCNNCKEENTEVLKATGHIVDLKVTKEPTCTEEGLKTATCSVCGEELSEKIPAKGHTYPEDWTTDKEASIFSEGQESKTCKDCGNVETQVIPKKEVPTAVPVSVGGISAAAIALFALKKTGKIGVKKAVEKATKDIVEDVAKDVVEEVAKDALEPEFEERTIVTCMKEADFYKSMKSQKYLVVVESEYDGVEDAIKENEPDLTLIDVSEKDLIEVKDNIETITNNLKEEEIETVISLLVSKQQLTEQKELLEQLKTDELIKDYASVDSKACVNLVKLVLPVMKPDLKSDEGLDNIGMVADALGIPGISTIISIYVSGREIKTTIEESKESEDGLGVVDKATIISDLASILGLDTIANVAGLVGDVDDIKSSLEAKMGANEISTTKDAVSDIIDVVSEIVVK